MCPLHGPRFQEISCLQSTRPATVEHDFLGRGSKRAAMFNRRLGSLPSNSASAGMCICMYVMHKLAFSLCVFRCLAVCVLVYSIVPWQYLRGSIVLWLCLSMSSGDLNLFMDCLISHGHIAYSAHIFSKQTRDESQSYHFDHPVRHAYLSGHMTATVMD
jgi:hypothetical protein